MLRWMWLQKLLPLTAIRCFAACVAASERCPRNVCHVCLQLLARPDGMAVLCHTGQLAVAELMH